MWLTGIMGGVAAFLGLFILFGPEDESVGLGGDLSWRVGDISNAWMYGLLIGGAVFLAGAVAMAVAGRKRMPVASSPLTDLLLHAGIFIAVNALVWIQDLAIGGGIDYALYMTIPWGIGLLIHGTVYALSRNRATPVLIEKEKEREREPQLM